MFEITKMYRWNFGLIATAQKKINLKLSIYLALEKTRWWLQSLWKRFIGFFHNLCLAKREREREIHFSRSVCSAINMRYTDVFRTRQNIWERPKRQKSTNKWQGWLSLTNCLNFRYHSLQNFSGFHSTYLKIFERDS